MNSGVGTTGARGASAPPPPPGNISDITTRFTLSSINYKLTLLKVIEVLNSGQDLGILHLPRALNVYMFT